MSREEQREAFRKSLGPVGLFSGSAKVHRVCSALNGFDAGWQAATEKAEERVKELEGSIQNGTASDGYHTFRELYEYRKAFNALLFNEWARLGKYDVHKSLYHSDGELCFGGGWFIVVAQLPTGQISNHYKVADWDMFAVRECEVPADYDGHTPAVALERMIAALSPNIEEEKC